MSTLKICLIGEEVGKTNFALRVANDTFINAHKKTEGLEVMKTELKIAGKTIEINLFDTRLEQFYKNSDGFIIFYDVTNLDSFNMVSKLYKNVRMVSDDAEVLFFGTKGDLKDKRAVSTSQGQDLAKKFKAHFGEGSSKSGENVCETFEKFIEVIVQKTPKDDQPLEDTPSNTQTNGVDRGQLRQQLKRLEDAETKLDFEKRKVQDEKRAIREQLDQELGETNANSGNESIKTTPKATPECLLEDVDFQNKLNGYCNIL